MLLIATKTIHVSGVGLSFGSIYIDISDYRVYSVGGLYSLYFGKVHYKGVVV